MLKKRIITALVGITIIVPIIWFGEPWFTIMLVVCGALGTFEFFRLVNAAKVPPLTCFGIIWAVLLIISRNSALLSLINSYFDTTLLMPLLLTSAIILPLIWLVLRPRKSETFTGWVWTIAGILYIGWLLGYFVSIRGIDSENSEVGRNWVFFTLFTTFASDSTAFFVGRALGKRHLAPLISPGKTWEGAIGGVIGAIIVSLLFTLPTPLKVNLNWAQAIALGLVVSVMGQLGDLAKSLFKRNTGAKDSSQLMPGHGGFLDRMDSVFFAGVVVYYYLLSLGGYMFR
jgi:phosphatidate cytidylyltransferase